MTDPTRSPIAALAKKWEKRIAEVEALIKRHESVLWPHRDCVTPMRAAALEQERLALGKCVRELEAAIDAQVEVFDRRLPATQDCESSRICDAVLGCCSDLKGEP